MSFWEFLGYYVACSALMFALQVALQIVLKLLRHL